MTFICIFERLNDKPRVKKIEEKHGFIRDIPTEVLEKACFIYDDDARIIIKNRKGIKGVVTREVLRTEAARYRHSVAYSRKSRRGMVYNNQ